jgi:hypothetical protein
MNKTPSAHHFRYNNPELDDLEAMVAYAKLCVSNALSAVQFHKKLRVVNFREETVDLLDSYECGDDEITVDFATIRKAYPLSNIKLYTTKTRKR